MFSNHLKSIHVPALLAWMEVLVLWQQITKAYVTVDKDTVVRSVVHSIYVLHNHVWMEVFAFKLATLIHVLAPGAIVDQIVPHVNLNWKKFKLLKITALSKNLFILAVNPCVPFGPCCQNPCLNEGTCTVNALNQAVCSCPLNYSGTRCESSK
jgi:hypothetical protein